MDFVNHFKKNIFETNAHNFEEKCLQIYKYQYSNCKIYYEFVNLTRKSNFVPKNIFEIPFLPIQFFKTHKVITGENKYVKIFESSGTNGIQTSKHYINNLEFYHTISKNIFEKIFFPLSECIIFPLLPSYSERNNSSLVSMVSYFMDQTNQKSKKYYLNQFSELYADIEIGIKAKKKIIVFGVTFALLDWADSHDRIDLPFYIIETGGMKGRKNEIVREEVHQILQNKFPNATICSEYGMTELLSQGYAKDGFSFEFPNWQKIVLREISDPIFLNDKTEKGGINIIDLANIDAVSFIETQDIAEKSINNSYKILGRIDNSDVRGCSLLYT